MEEILASIRRIIADDQSLTAHRLQPLFEEHAASTEPAEMSTAEADDISVSQEGSPLEEHAEEISMVKEPSSAPKEAAAPRSVEPSRRGDTDHVPSSRNIFEEAKRSLRKEKSALSAAAPAREADAPYLKQEDDFSDMRLRPQLEEAERPVASHPSVTPTSYQAPERTAEPAAAPVEEPLISATTDAAVATSFSALFASRLLPDRQAVAEMTRDLLRPMLKAWLDDNLPVMVERLVRAEIERVARGGR